MNESTYLGLPFADAYMRSLWEGGGHGEGVTLFRWKEDNGEEEEEEEEETMEEEEGWGERQQRRRAVRSVILSTPVQSNMSGLNANR